MWFDGVRQPNTIYIANSSRGKDSTAMLRAIQILGWPLDYVVSVDVWATDEIPAELPPMCAFKDEWDAKCFDTFGVPVTRLCAMKDGRKLTYDRLFHEMRGGGSNGRFPIAGWPYQHTPKWCNDLKRTRLSDFRTSGTYGATVTSRKGLSDKDRSVVPEVSQGGYSTDLFRDAREWWTETENHSLHRDRG